MQINKPRLYRKYEPKFNALLRENCGGPPSWARLTELREPEVLPLLLRVWDLYFLAGHQPKEVDAALLCYSLVSLLNVAYWADRSARHPFMLFASAAEDDIVPHATLWVQLDYNPYARPEGYEKHFKNPCSDFGTYVKRLCDAMVPSEKLVCVEWERDGATTEDRVVLLDAKIAFRGERYRNLVCADSAFE